MGKDILTTDNWRCKFIFKTSGPGLTDEVESDSLEQDFLMTKLFFTQAERTSVKAELMKYAERIVDEFLKKHYK